MKIVLMTLLPGFYDVTFSGLAYPNQKRHNRGRSKFRVFHQNLDYLSRYKVSFKQTFHFDCIPSMALMVSLALYDQHV